MEVSKMTKAKLTPNGLYAICLLSIVIIHCHHKMSYPGSLFVEANKDAKRLYEELMLSYNRLVRPVGNDSEILEIKLGIKLSQLIDVNLRYQIMTTIVWVEHEWTDYKLKWDPDEYDGINKLHVPAEDIWLPDLVLYNNADGNYEVTILTKAIIHNDGRVNWNPPAVYKSYCNMDVSYFPFDQQTCNLKFGTWSWNGKRVDLRHVKQQSNTNSSRDNNTITVEKGIDLSEFLLSVEWDVMKVPATRHENQYVCCEGAFTEFAITLRRKTLFYTVNLIIPCIAMSLLSILVFYLPSDSNEKVSLSISIVVSVDVFLLCLIEIIPPTSFTVPLLGQYLLFMLFLVTLSVIATVFVLNISFRTSSTHRMSKFERLFYLKILPIVSLMGQRENKKIEEMKLTKLRTCDLCQKGRRNSNRRCSSSHRQQSRQSVGRCNNNQTLMSPKRNNNHNQTDGYYNCNNSAMQYNQNNAADDDIDLGYHEDMGMYSDSQCFSSRTTYLGINCRGPSCGASGTNYRHHLSNYEDADQDDDGDVNDNDVNGDGDMLMGRPNNMFIGGGRQMQNLSSSSLRRRHPYDTNDPLDRIGLASISNNYQMANDIRRATFSKNRTDIELDGEIKTECQCDKEYAEEEISLCGLQREVANAFLSLDFVSKRMENRENYNMVEEDWRYVATMLDRFLLIVFSLVCVIGTIFIVVQTPVRQALYNTSEPIDIIESKMGRKIRNIT